MKRELAHIAYVDDDPDILFVAEFGLQIAGGLRADLICGPESALQQLASLSPDLVLLDVMMPVIDGPTLLQDIRRHPQLSRTPVIFMTARVQPREVAQYIALGAIGVISKPFDVMTLANDIRDIWKNWNHASAVVQ